MSKPRLAIAIFLCVGCGGDVMGSAGARLAKMTVADDAGVQVSNIELRVIEVRSDDGTKTLKSFFFAFDAEGEALAGSMPGLKYACSVPGAVVTDGFSYPATDVKDGRTRPRLHFNGLDDYLRSNDAGEPTACELELRLQESGPIASPSQPRAHKPLGKLCYVHADGRRALTDGACPESVLVRTPPGGDATLAARVLTARRVASPPDDRPQVVFGTLLTVNKAIPGEPFTVVLLSICDGEVGMGGLGAADFGDALPGESIWLSGALNDAAAEAKRCEITVHTRHGEAEVELARRCYQGGALRDGGCA